MAEERQSPQKVSNALSEAQAIVDGARKRASDLLEDAERQLRLAKEEGFQKGFDEGLRQAAAAAVRLIEDSGSVRDRLAAQAASLAFTIAEKVVGGHIDENPESVLALARHAIQESVVGDEVTIISHPADAALLQKNEKDLRRLAGGALLHFDADDSLTRGGCIVRSEFGEVDASIDSLLEQLATKVGVKRNER